MTPDLADKLEKAKALANESHFSEAITNLRTIINDNESNELNDVTIKLKEKAIKRLGKIFMKLDLHAELAVFLNSLKPFFDAIPKAKTAKIVRLLIDLLCEIPNTENLVINICNEHISWASQQNRVFLCQRLKFKLAYAYYKVKEYSKALKITSELILEVRKLDDKPMLVEIHLLECKIFHGLLDISRARAALSSARTSANAIYCPPKLQADIDIQSGQLHCEERDYKTAYSYFLEAFENYGNILKEHTIDQHINDDSVTLANSPLNYKERANLQSTIDCLKFMLLCKIMDGIKEDVQSLINGKFVLKYASVHLKSMRAIASAQFNSSLKEFKQAMDEYRSDFQKTPLIYTHLNYLYDILLEENLSKLIEPFSQVRIAHIAGLIELGPELVEKKLSKMILDKKLDGILDQGSNTLIIFDEPPQDTTYSNSLKLITELNKVVDCLYNKASLLG